MFSNSVVDTDMLLDMPLTTQALYFHLGMHTDDEGFVNSPQKIVRALGCQPDDFKLLVAKGFVICFDNGVIAITHFHQNNTIRKDRLTPTRYQELKTQLTIENNEYKMVDNHMTTICQPTDNQTSTKCPHNIIQDNIIEDNINTLLSTSVDGRTAFDYKSVVDLFNSVCVSLPKVAKLSENRKRNIKNAHKQLDGNFEDFFHRIEQSDFLTGRSGNWNGCSFDWILKPSNLIKILEGNYDNKNGNSGKKGNFPTLQDYLEEF